MLKSALVAATLVLTTLLTLSIKHVPLFQLFGTSALVVTLGGLGALGLKIGWRDFFDMFVGRGDKQNVKIAVMTLAMTAAVGMILSLMVVMNNLQNRDVIGPGLAASVIPAIYSLLLSGYLSIVHAPKPGQDQKKNLSKYTSLAVSLAAVSLDQKETQDEKHAA